MTGGALAPLGVGLVGCGGFAEFVLDAVAGLPGLRLVAVADPRATAPRGSARGTASRRSPPSTSSSNGTTWRPC